MTEILICAVLTHLLATIQTVCCCHLGFCSHLRDQLSVKESNMQVRDGTVLIVTVKAVNVLIYLHCHDIQRDDIQNPLTRPLQVPNSCTTSSYHCPVCKSLSDASCSCKLKFDLVSQFLPDARHSQKVGRFNVLTTDNMQL